MRNARLASSLLTLALVLPAFVFGQAAKPAASAEEREKKKKEFDERVVQMLDEALAGLNGLRLPGNRAIVYAMVGDMYWRFDEKRSRELFRQAAAEIVNNNAENERARNESPEQYPGEIDMLFDVRPQVLPLIGNRDPELALELMGPTRSTRLSEAMAATGAGSTDPMMASRVSQELALEQGFAARAADKDPELAVKLIRESLARGVSYNVLGLLQKLHTKDDKKAAELGSEVIKRLVDADLARNMSDMNTALNFLQFNTTASSQSAAAAAGKVRPFTFSEIQMRELAARVTAALTGAASNAAQTASMITRAIPIIEKIAPDRATVLRQRQSQVQRNLSPSEQNMQQQMRMWDPSSTPEEILGAISRMRTDSEKTNAYTALTNKIGQLTDETRARRLIDQIPDEKARTNAREQFDAQRLTRLAAAGKLDDARRVIATLTDRRRKIQSLINLAQQHQRRAGEGDLDTALALMTEAKSFVNDYPEEIDEIEFAMTIAAGYATIDAESGFRMLEPMIDIFNEHTAAVAVISKYDKRNAFFRRGELIMRMGGPGGFGGGGLSQQPLLMRFLPQMQALARADLDRMNGLANRLIRSDAQMITKLLALQTALQPAPAPRPVPAPR
jgi:hypothetical protein